MMIKQRLQFMMIIIIIEELKAPRKPSKWRPGGREMGAH